MKQLLRSRLAVAVIAACAAVGLFAGGMAFAGGSGPPVKVNGGANTQVKTAGDVNGWGPDADGTWENVAGSKLVVSVPSGGRTITAFFSAESTCSATNWCAVRIVAQRGDGPIIELHPREGSDYAFDDDAGDTETYESNAMGRSMRLANAGTWRVWPQGMVDGTGDMYLDDWYFEVNVHK
jgi:hypothetical protein